MLKRLIQRYKLQRQKSSIRRQIDDADSFITDESFRCMRKHEKYVDFEAEFRPICNRLHDYIDKKKKHLKELERIKI